MLSKMVTEVAVQLVWTHMAPNCAVVFWLDGTTGSTAIFVCISPFGFWRMASVRDRPWPLAGRDGLAMACAVSIWLGG